MGNYLEFLKADEEANEISYGEKILIEKRIFEFKRILETYQKLAPFRYRRREDPQEID